MVRNGLTWAAPFLDDCFLGAILSGGCDDWCRCSAGRCDAPLCALDVLSLVDSAGDLAGSRSEASSSDSEDNDKTLLCFKSEFENALVLVCRDVFVFRLEILAALESHGGLIMLSRTCFQENGSLSAGFMGSWPLTCTCSDWEYESIRLRLWELLSGSSWCSRVLVLRSDWEDISGLSL